MSLTVPENQQASSTPVASKLDPKLDAIHEAQETSSSVDPKPEDLAPHSRVVVHTDVPYAPSCRFFPGKAKEVIGAVLREKLTGVTYDADSAPQWVREVTDIIKVRLKGLVDLDHTLPSQKLSTNFHLLTQFKSWKEPLEVQVWVVSQDGEKKSHFLNLMPSLTFQFLLDDDNFNMELDRYKIVVQAVVGEQRGQGFQMSCRCFWDPNTDNLAYDSFANDSIFCVAGAFAMYLP